MSHWRDHAVPTMRHEALYGDRVVRCFADRPASLLAMFDDARARRPQHDAVVYEGRRWSYAETCARSERVAAALAAQGVGAGDRVILFLSNRPEFVFVLLAVQRLGAIAVPVGVREQRPGLAYVANQCGAKAIVFDDALVDRVPGYDEAAALQVRVPAAGLAALEAAAPSPPAVATTLETDVAVILYTSGTTGHPKGAMLTHLAIVHSALHFEACMRLTSEDRSALAVPASHVTGLIATIAAM